MWTFSGPVDAQEARRTGAFTSLPIRIHRRNDIADAATIQSLRDWNQHVGDGWERKSGSAMSPVGNWGAFIFPESFEERLFSITYLASIGNIHDGNACEDMDLEEAVRDHQHFSDALQPEAVDDVADGAMKQRKMKSLVSKIMLDILALDRDMGLRMLQSYREKWLDVMEKPDFDKVESMEKYLEFRMLNGGMEPFWLMCQFGMGLNLPDNELELLRPIFEPAEAALVLTNDYFSWDREYHSATHTGARIVNSIDLLRRTRGLSIDEARQAVKQLIVDYEQDYLAQKETYIKENPNLPAHVHLFIEVCGLVVAGNHYWCANCPRHHAWQHQTEVNAKVLDGPELKTTELPIILLADGKSKDDSKPKPIGPPARRDSALDTETWDTPSPADAATQDLDPLEAPCAYIASLPSKGVRNTLIDALNQWFGLPPARIEPIKAATTLLHNASLMLDDVQDGSLLRRGRPAAHVVFGAAQAINSATSMFVRAARLVAATGIAPADYTSFLDSLHALHAGQAWDLHWKAAARAVPSRARYFDMVDGKTGAMFDLVAQLMRAQAHQRDSTKSQPLPDLDRFGKLFGRFFQALDDYRNLRSDAYAGQKGECEDLDEGKKSFLVVLCHERRPDLAAQVLGIFANHSCGNGQQQPAAPMPAATKAYIVGLFDQAGVFDAALDWLRQAEDELLAEIADVERRVGVENHMLRLLVGTLSVKTEAAVRA
ncbi:geranylgeranyl pyrophosphate synthase [Diplodia corticola]|uniref:Geranylgeranyl pyrophosphate synthase n=1 Tax=Diplodia corticola TaxID=236234 RepID=A0A1J9RXB7_9PEZI|nr:geranylgeranyl pyrophosphate synthase [Diplodia corticola]OJD32476.1 geranylgeranyl pyrophosphate synthase [Diplodia corticola]